MFLQNVLLFEIVSFNFVLVKANWLSVHFAKFEPHNNECESKSLFDARREKVVRLIILPSQADGITFKIPQWKSHESRSNSQSEPQSVDSCE